MRPRSVLVVRTDEIGDMVLTAPLLVAMRETWPQALITLVAEPGPATLLAGTTLVDEVVTWRPAARGHNSFVAQAHAWSFARRHLRRRDVDLAVLPRRDMENGPARYIASASGAKVVAGFDPLDRPHLERERAEAALLTVAVPSGHAPVHEVEHGRRLRAALGVALSPGDEDRPGLAVFNEADHVAAAEILRPLLRADGPLVGVCLGAGHPKREWPAAHYAAAVHSLAQQRDVRVVLIGGPNDGAAAAAFRAVLPMGVPVVDAVGRTSLRTSLALLHRSDVYLGGDTGTMHMASSVGTPCVVLSCHPATGSATSTHSPERFGPWSSGSHYLQPALPAGDCSTECVAPAAHCIATITVDSVVAALTSVLANERRESLA